MGPGVQIEGPSAHPSLWFINKGWKIIYKTIHQSDHWSNSKYLLKTCCMTGAGVKPQRNSSWPWARKDLPSKGEMIMKYPENTSKNNLTAII